MGHLEDFSKWPARRFIETGFGEGRTLAAAAKVYEQCLTIELHEGRYMNAVEMFAGQPNVRVYHGNSPEILKRIVDPSISTVFWLDAHYVRGDSPMVEGFGLCPILEELQIIRGLDWAEKPVILIDDWSTFRTVHQGWPELKKIDELMGVQHHRRQDLPGTDVFEYDWQPMPAPEPAKTAAEIMAEARNYLPEHLREAFDHANAAASR